MKAAARAKETAPLDLDKIRATPAAEVLSSLGSGTEGLTSDAAGAALARYGPNELAEERTSALGRLLAGLWGPIPWMIEIAALLSAIVRDWADFAIIFVMLFANAAIDFWNAYKADNAIALLRSKLAPEARVRRDGAWKVVPAMELVPGDVVRVRLGDVIPADLKLIDGDSVELDQSALTGESLPVERESGEVALSGSIVRRGEMDGAVVATGMGTFFGRTARLVERAETTSHYQQAILRIGHYLILSTAGLGTLIVLTALFRGTPMLETFHFVLVLTVAAIPVALPAVLSVTMAVGAVDLARREAVVSRLVAIEELAGMDILCSDKTGTLTQNRLVMGDPIPYGDAAAADLVRAAALASRAEDRDALDLAILAGVDAAEASTEGFTVEAFTPFDPVRKRADARARREGRAFEVTKGAPQAVLALGDPDEALAKWADEEVATLAAKGSRALGVARREDGGPWRFLGLLAFFDPPREDSAQTVADARALGVGVKMITGDNVAIAREISGQLGIGANIATPEALGPAGATDGAAIERVDGFAQVFPEHKFRIVEALQHAGHYVGMTGDGVNDAPALKQANVGVAVSGATDAARSAADLVLTAPGLSVIIDAIRESRRIFRRMNSYAVYRIAETIRLLLFMTLSILIFDFYPVTAAMIVLLALFNDGPILLIAYDRVEPDPRPTRWDMRTVLGIATILGILGVVASFGVLWAGEMWLHLGRAQIQTLIFLKLMVAGNLTIYLCRTGPDPFWTRPFPAPSLVWVGFGTRVLATAAAALGWLVEPIGWKLAAGVWVYSIAWFVVNDAVKVWARRLMTHQTRWDRPHAQRIHAAVRG